MFVLPLLVICTFLQAQIAEETWLLETETPRSHVTLTHSYSKTYKHRELILQVVSYPVV